MWGLKPNIQNFEILNDVLEKHDLKPKGPPPAKTTYDLGKNPEGLRDEMQAMGFTKVRIWYQPMNFNFADADNYAEGICHTNLAVACLKNVDAEKRAAVVADLKALYNERMGPHVLDPKSFEVMVITAVKP